jgi:choline dehydrogenase
LHALAEKVIIDGNRATGVLWSDKAGRHEARAQGEVIVCGGTFNSPQLLQLSGVGPGELLKGNGIAVLHELSGVGENLQDHFGIGLQFRSTKRTTVNDLYNNVISGGVQFVRYILFRNGPFSDNGNYSNTFIHSTPEIPTPDMMVTFMAWCTKEDLTPFPFSGFTILAEHMRPDSRGHVRIKSSDPAEPPLIQFNFFATEADRRAAMAGLRFGRKISQTSPMSECVEREITPGLEVQSDEQIIAYCRESGLSLLHPVGTCKMGVASDAVVDRRLRVIGMDGLRVVDASIMPRIVTGNTNAAAIMIGEKGASIILEDARS